jgi:hypothetical protein
MYVIDKTFSRVLHRGIASPGENSAPHLPVISIHHPTVAEVSSFSKAQHAASTETVVNSTNNTK